MSEIESANSDSNINNIENIEKALTDTYPDEQKAKHKASFEKWIDEYYNKNENDKENVNDENNIYL